MENPKIDSDELKDIFSEALKQSDSQEEDFVIRRLANLIGAKMGADLIEAK